jgi:Uma2 family endonuclease
MVIRRKLYTVDEFAAFTDLPENRERRFELINGEIREKMPTQRHGIIVALIVSFLVTFVRPRNLGRVAVEVRHRMPDDDHNAHLPDVSFYADTGTPIVERGEVPHMPDLAVEVKSPDDTYQEMRDKAAYYLANGSKMVWLVYPEKRFVEVYRQGVDLQILTEEDTIEGDPLLPGFRLSVQDIFAE